jgi:bla regulator protein BlaR1
MDALFQTALSNALLVAAVAPVVWAITKLTAKPALTHALWLVVLLKLIAPPLWSIPFHWPQPRQNEIERVHEPEAPAVVPSATGAETVPDFTEVHYARRPLPVVHAAPALQSAETPAARHFDFARMWETGLESLWIGGSVLCLAIAVIRIWRFARSLRYATLASGEVQLRIEQLAQRLNLNRAPRVWFIPGTLSPMLWAVGGPARLLIPQALWERLNSIQRDAILIHELAHWQRRDHWVRWIELLATTFYWWHPACWWARRELREAEEQCCDGWVLYATGDFRHYANALLEAVEFVSSRVERPFPSSAVPALASGLGQFGHLKRRIIMLKNGNISRALSGCGIAATFTMASLLLPLSPTLAQESPRNEALNQPVSSASPETPQVVTSDQPGADNANDAVRELREAKQQIDDLKRKLLEAEAKLSVLQQGADRGRLRWTATSPIGVGNGAPTQLPSGYEPAPGAQDDGANRDPRRSVSPERLDRIEAELRSLLHEVESMRGRASVVPDKPDGKPLPEANYRLEGR